MKRKKINIAALFLNILLVFQALSGFFGGITLTIDPSGKMLKMPLLFLKNSPFPNFLIPGLILFLLLGLLPLFIFFCNLLKMDFSLFKKMSIFKQYSSGWNFSLYTGIILVIWIDFELIFIQDYSFLQPFYSLLGVAIIILSLMPSVMKHYKVSSNIKVKGKEE